MKNIESHPEKADAARKRRVGEEGSIATFGKEEKVLKKWKEDVSGNR